MVTDVQPLGGQDEREVLRLAAGVEASSDHPLARATVTRARELGLNIPAAQDGQALAGRGVCARVDGRMLYVVSPAYAEEQGWWTQEARAQVNARESEGKTVILLVESAQPLGLIALRDEARPDAREAARRLRALGVRWRRPARRCCITARLA